MDRLTGKACVSGFALAIALAASVLGPVALAGSAGAIRHIEGLEGVAVMTVDVHVMIEADGSVSQANVDTKIVPALAESLGKSLLKWRFEPVVVSGQARRANTKMRIALAAEQEGDSYRVRLDGVDYPDAFDPAAVRPDGQLAPISAGRMSPPGYPPPLQMRGVMGRVLLAIRVTPEGTAGEITVVQSLLYDFGRPIPLSRRTVADFESVAKHAARNWTFNVPAGPARDPEDMTVTVPVVFTMGYDLDVPGQWLTVQRAPRQNIPWLPATQARSGLGLASSGGGSVSQFGGGPKLLQDIAGTALP